MLCSSSEWIHRTCDPFTLYGTKCVGIFPEWFVYFQPDRNRQRLRRKLFGPIVSLHAVSKIHFISKIPPLNCSKNVTSLNYKYCPKLSQLKLQISREKRSNEKNPNSDIFFRIFENSFSSLGIPTIQTVSLSTKVLSFRTSRLEDICKKIEKPWTFLITQTLRVWYFPSWSKIPWTRPKSNQCWNGNKSMQKFLQ